MPVQVDFVLALFDRAYRVTIRLRGRPRDAVGVVVVARRCADPDAELTELFEFRIDCREHRFIVRLIINGRQIDGRNVVLLVMIHCRPAATVSPSLILQWQHSNARITAT